MNPLDRLANLLAPGLAFGRAPLSTSMEMAEVIAEMSARQKTRSSGSIPADHKQEAVRRFWDRQEILNFRDAYLLSWSLCIPHRPQGTCVMEDRPRLERVLEGADEYSNRPKAYRRCYQGLVSSYFGYEPTSDEGKRAAKENWRMFRDYLRDRRSIIAEPEVNPDWVQTAQENPELFAPDPYAPYVDLLLSGNAGAIDQLSEHLGIGKESWFLRGLIMAQVRRAAQLEDRAFLQYLPRLLEVLAGNGILRDAGLILLIDRYADVAGRPLHLLLRDMTVQ